ncbi:MAG: hypothetical protein KDD69_09660 [Bdellovibrionales bacterium]|nr:hypothetical protein [Bdellovibrionales bacterium]
MAISFCRATLCSLVFAVGCAASPENAPIPEDYIVTQQRAALPITEAVQTMNIPVEESWQAVLQILESRSIPVASARAPQGELVTAWIPVTDQICGVQGAAGAPIACEVQLKMRFEPLTRVASSFAIGFVQRCHDLPQQVLECPNSRGEQILVGIVRDLERAAGMVQELQN